MCPRKSNGLFRKSHPPILLIIVSIASLILNLPSIASEESPFAKPDCGLFPDGPVTTVQVYLHLRSCQEKQTLSVIWGNRTARDALLHGIAAAESDWMDVSLLLLPHANQPRSTAILRAFQEALVVNPGAVLSRISSKPSVLRSVCGYPSGLTYDLASASVSERMSAVETWLSERSNQFSSKMIRTAEKCATILERAEKQMEKEFKE